MGILLNKLVKKDSMIKANHNSKDMMILDHEMDQNNKSKP